MKNSSLNSINVRKHIGKDEKILITTRACLGRDKKKCIIVITGVPFDDNALFYKEIYVYVFSKECMDKKQLKGGYNPHLQVLCFNGAENSMYITIDSGGSGGFVFFYIINFNRCKMKTVISDEMFNNEYNNYAADYKNYYKVRVRRGNSVYGIDISCKGFDYLSDLYHSDGTLKKPTSGYVSGANYTFPTVNKDSTHDLVVYQKVVGLAQVDGLGLVQTRFSFAGDTYKEEEISMITYSYPLKDCLPLY